MKLCKEFVIKKARNFFLSLQVPCVGVSLGIERIFSIMEKKLEVMTHKSSNE